MWHIPNITQKNCLFCYREQPNLFIKRSSLNIMDVMRHKRFGCNDVYDKHFLSKFSSSITKSSRYFCTDILMENKI